MSGDYIRLFLVVVVDYADKGLHYVLESNYTGTESVFVAHEGAAYTFFLHLLKHSIHTHGFVEIHGLVYHGFKIEAFFPDIQDKILERKNSDDMVKITVCDRIGLEKVFFDCPADLGFIHILVKPYDIPPEGHDGVDLEVSQGKYPFHDILFNRRYFAFVRAFLDD